MERGGPVAVRRLVCIALLLLAFCGAAVPASRVLVLVVRADSPVVDLDSVTLRKLFLGVPVLVNGKLLHPIRNRSAEHLDEIFLQEIVGMSQSAYDRQILGGVNRQGWRPPAEANSSARVLAALYEDQQAVAFMWQSEIGHDPRVRVVRILWSE